MRSNFNILLVEDMDSFRGAVSQLLGVYNDVDEAIDMASARLALSKQSYDVVILDKGLPDGDGVNLIPEIKDLSPNTVVIILTSDHDFSSVKHCIAKGADDYVVKSENVVPDLLVRIPLAVSKVASKRKLDSLDQLVKSAFRYEIVGKSEQTMQLRETIMGLKNSDAHVLVTGESGTGKELIARRLNAIEDSGDRPFVAINCGALAKDLIESELFGHKKGSFTGATQDRSGKFEMAHNGDLFLDEVGELTLAAQVKLLRAIQEGEVTRVGDSRSIKVKCRIIAATNQPLEAMVSAGTFREDLFHRLNVFRIQTTPLRSRIADVPDLARAFTLQIGGSNFKISEQAIRALHDYDWPGNIRELRNTIERAVISARKRKSFELLFEDISIQQPAFDVTYAMRRIQAELPLTISDLTPEKYRNFVETIEKAYLRAALIAAESNATEVAERIGLNRSTVFKKLRKYGCKPKKARLPMFAQFDDDRSDIQSEEIVQ